MRSIPEWIAANDDQRIPARVKLRVVDSQRPAPGELPICPCCGQPIREGDGTDFDHNVALADGGEHREGNLQAIHRACHKKKTAREALVRAETRTAVKKAYGLKGKGRGKQFRQAKPQNSATRPIDWRGGFRAVR